MQPQDAYHSALDKRREMQQEARAMGISEEYISLLVDRFYQRVRADSEIGPIFEEEIDGHWPEHLARMKAFWNSIALRSGIYSGKPVEAHQDLTGVKREHFPIWLRLFEETLRETAPSKEVVPFFMRFAGVIAARLQEVMFA